MRPNPLEAALPWAIRLRRNPSWRNSVATLLRGPLLYAPSSLLHAAGECALTLLMAALSLPLVLFIWVGTLIIQILAGLAGFVTPQGDH